jgi:hypothetical protein
LPDVPPLLPIPPLPLLPIPPLPLLPIPPLPLLPIPPLPLLPIPPLPLLPIPLLPRVLLSLPDLSVLLRVLPDFVLPEPLPLPDMSDPLAPVELLPE